MRGRNSTIIRWRIWIDANKMENREGTSNEQSVLPGVEVGEAMSCKDVTEWR